jgi:hypothetical protein
MELRSDLMSWGANMSKEFFSHDHNARDDKKMQYLMMKEGLSGVGAFWCIIEMLAEEDGYLMRSECERIAFALRSESEFINRILFEYDLFEFDEDRFWSESLLRRLQIKYDKSEKARESANRRWNNHKKKTDANAMRTHSEGNASKLNETKLNKYLFDNFWDDYDYKKERKKCETKWKSIPDKEKELIREFIPIYKAYVQRVDYLELKYPYTFLNSAIWNDDWSEYKPKSTAQGMGAFLI